MHKYRGIDAALSILGENDGCLKALYTMSKLGSLAGSSPQITTPPNYAHSDFPQICILSAAI